MFELATSFLPPSFFNYLSIEELCIDKRLSRGELCSCQLSAGEQLRAEAPRTLAGSIARQHNWKLCSAATFGPWAGGPLKARCGAKEYFMCVCVCVRWGESMRPAAL